MSTRWLFFTLFSINLLNYIDRQILFAVFPLIKADLNLSDTHLGLLGSAFMVVYTIIAPFIGYFADRTPRQIWISISAFLWSLATMLTGLVKNYWQLLTARALIGVGESGFTSVSPSFLAERFPLRMRAKVLAFYGMALPLGSALGYLIGASLSSVLGWRHVFWIAGLPGIILALVVFFKVKDRRRTPPKHERPGAMQYIKLLGNKPFLFVCLAQAMGTFTLGGIAAWMPVYFTRYFDMSVAQAGSIFGGLTIVSGAFGTILGGIIADKLLAKTPRAFFYTPAISYCLALPFGILFIFTPDTTLALIFLGIATACAFLQTGPLQAAVVSTTNIKIRSMAFALNIFIIHALGDAISPTAIGIMSDISSLKTAMLLSLMPIILAAVFAVIAAHFYTPLPDDSPQP